MTPFYPRQRRRYPWFPTVVLLMLQSSSVVAQVVDKPIHTYTCPKTVGTVQPIELRADGHTVRLRRAMTDGLCTLVMVRTSNDDATTWIPMARAYHGRPWERAGGTVASKLPAWDCRPNYCTTTALPAGTYALQQRALEPLVLSLEDANARFYETVSFGVTTELLTSDQAPSRYVFEQMELPITSLREYYRRHANPSWLFHQPEFAGRLDPCVKASASSTFTHALFTLRDQTDSTFVRVDWIQASAQITVHGHVRSVLPQFRYADVSNRSGTTNVPTGTYEFCNTIDFARGIYKLRIGGRCRELLDAAIVDFAPGHEPSSNQSIAFTFPSLSNTAAWHQTSAGRLEYLYRYRINRSACADLITPTHSGKNTEYFDGAPMFAVTNAGEWVRHDPRVALLDNARPLADGGLQAWRDGKVLSCSNVKRNRFNEGTCRMATAESCAPGTISPWDGVDGGMVCGSVGEIANDLGLGSDQGIHVGSIGFFRKTMLQLPADVATSFDFHRQRERIWSTVVLKADDQLRHRTAWALSQIFSLPSEAIIKEQFSTEIFLQYYDIFVRNAFGSYLDLLREVSYNPLNAESLTYLNGVSSSRILRYKNQTIFPDENYAREIMQLFSIGLYELNMDGTHKLDSAGKPIATYNNEHILSFARVWVGFHKQAGRANVEVPTKFGLNQFDPLEINVSDRDHFPKMDLYGGYIGDGKPLCVDLPYRSHLRVGAKYRLLGKSAKADYLNDPEEWAASDADIRRLVVSSGELYDLLCEEVDGSVCSYPSVVTVEANIGCIDGSAECDIDRPRVIQIGAVYYEYVQVPCVHQAFIQNARKVMTNSKNQQAMCAHPQATSAAGVACCGEATPTNSAVATCHFAGERTTLVTAERRCAAQGKFLCEYASLDYTSKCPDDGLDNFTNKSYKWTNEPCSMSVEIDSTGSIKLIHNAGSGSLPFSLDGPNFFPVAWNKAASYPTIENNCSDGLCKSTGSACLCGAVVTNEAVFTVVPANADEILDSLRIGYHDIRMFDGDDFVQTKTSQFEYYQPASQGSTCCSSDTVFLVTDRNGVDIVLKNIVSMVSVGGSSSDISFRNPPHYHNLAHRDATNAEGHDEVNALLQHLFYHPNTAPFVAKNLIQRFGTSNPSPTYVNDVATAFQAGHYENDGIVFGTNAYGNMASTIAAVVLHPEKSSAVIDSDPTAGGLREPILKVLSFMRSMDFTSDSQLVQLWDMNRKVGQMAFNQPSVFSWFRSEYQPPGPVAAAELTAPEMEVMTSTNVVGLLNGLVGLVIDGFVECASGFDVERSCQQYEPSGEISYQGSSNRLLMINDMVTRITAGRLSESNRALILAAIEAESDTEVVFAEVAKFLIFSPEFHSTNRADLFADIPSLSSENTVSDVLDSQYKAVIHISLHGGCDSSNVLVPQSSCPSRSEYDEVRGDLKLDDSELIDLNDGDVHSQQSCSKFSVHHRLPILKELWDAGELLFTANTGVLTEPVTVDNYEEKMLTSVFAHNSMRDEVSKMDPSNTVVGTGTLGRMAAVLQRKGYQTGRVVVDSMPTNLATSSTAVKPIVSLGIDGLHPFVVDGEPSIITLRQLNINSTSGMYGNLWTEILHNSLNQTDELVDILALSPVSDADFVDPDSTLSKRLKLIAQMIAARKERGVNRDHFYVSQDGYDTHQEVKERSEKNFSELNDALTGLVSVLKQLGVWNNVVIVQTSEFGRSLTSSGNLGSDHGWGGHYFIASGSARGKQMVGQFPESLAIGHDLDIGRGRLLPTTSWDSIFNGIADWMGATEVSDFNSILPNRKSFPEETLFTHNDLFRSNSASASIASVEATIAEDRTGAIERNDDSDECQTSNFIGECTMTFQCIEKYGAMATSCWNGGAGVCYSGFEITGCVAASITA